LDNYDKTIDDYLNWLATFDLQDEIKDDPEKLQLMTIHAAKGLEWPTVIIAGLNEGIFPSKQSIKKNELEDERRLAYVAFTRAEDQLILTTRPFEKDKELFIKNPASRFIKESSGVKQLVEA
jgi:DNA helicase-2/ATP-dependent DNA helicase PcrA